jgi:hypothetical protein
VKASVALILGCTVVACGSAGTARDAATRTDSSGVEVVTNSSADQALTWEFRPVLTLGGENDGPEAFFEVPGAGVAFGSEGQIVVLDAGSKRVHVFSESGEIIRSMARGGRGPGELQYPSSVFVDSIGSVLVHDFGHRALLEFDSSGNFVGQTAAPAGVFQPIRSDAGVDVFATRRRNANTGQYAIRLFRAVGPDTLELAETPVPPTRSALYESCGVSITLPPLFAGPPSWDARGGRVALSAPPDYLVRIFTDGSEVRHIRRSIPAEPATYEAVLREFGEGEPFMIGNRRCTIPAEELVEHRGYSELIPTTSRIALAPDGYLWVQREVVGEPNGPIDIFDSTGEYAGTLPIATPWPLAFGSNNRMLVLKSDDLDVQRVVVYRIVRN